MAIRIYDVMQEDDPGVYRGGGRFMQMLRENLKKDAIFAASVDVANDDDILVVPVWEPFQAPILTKRVAKKQVLVIFDVIPLRHKHHFPAGIKGRFALWKNKKNLHNYDEFITISKHARTEIVNQLHIPKKEIKVVYPTYTKFLKTQTTKDDSEILSKHGLEKNNYCLYVGDVNWNKNITNIARAMTLAGVQCAYAGKIFNKVSAIYDSRRPHPWLREFKKFTATVDNNALFPGYVPDEELKVLYKHALCNILISHDEGFGMSYLEAATQKCPSILSNIPVFREIALDSARFVDRNNPHQIAKAIKDLKKSAKMRKTLSEAAFKRSKDFSPAIFRKSMRNAILNI